MIRSLATLRTLGLLMVVAGVVDPGCPRPVRPRLAVTMVGDVPADVGQHTLRELADAAPWATVVDASTTATATDDDVRVAARVVAGDPAPVARALETRRAALAWQVDGPALTLESISVPSRVVSGTRTDVHVRVGGVPARPGKIRVVLRDLRSAVEQGDAEVATTDAPTGQATVRIPWLATRPGAGRLRVEASFDGSGVRPAAPGDVAVDVRPAGVEVSVLEARPTWGARFARLALAAADGVRVRSEVRVSPGVSVRTDPPDGGGPPRVEDGPDVVLVGGLEALNAGDVSRLERDVRERGRAVVLLADEAPGPGAWQRLWPDSTGTARSVARPVVGLVAGHPWKMREWLAAPVSTSATPLAYLDSGSPPFLLGRAHGAGRIVLVTALDGWRWRAEEGVAYAAGWRALVQRLALDVPPPMATTAWVTGRGRERWLQVDVALRPDLAARDGMSVLAEFASGTTRVVPLARVETGRWRGALRVRAAPASRLVVEARQGAEVVARTQDVVDLSPPAQLAAWDDVERYQAERGDLAAGAPARAEALTALRARLKPPATHRWYITRTWWFAGLALTLLGAEWMLRRLHGRR